MPSALARIKNIFLKTSEMLFFKMFPVTQPTGDTTKLTLKLLYAKSFHFCINYFNIQLFAMLKTE